MPGCRAISPGLAAALLLACGICGAQEPVYSKLVQPGADGRLTYTPYTDKGDTIPDFSCCGYMGGGIALPDVPVKLTVGPDGDDEDDLSRLQAAVDQVAALPLDGSGHRGALLIKRGRYRLGGTLRVRASGVVIRGEGPGEDGTVLIATQRKNHTVIVISGDGSPAESPDTRQPITDDYVPVGARSFSIADASGFKVGDDVIVRRPSTGEWLSFIKMDRIKEQHKDVKQWTPGSRDLPFMRRITGIDGNRITVDAPVVNALQKEFGGGLLYRYEFPGRIEQTGIENLRGESEYDGKEDEEHAWNFISFDRARDCWARDITSIHFAYACVSLNRTACAVTVQDCQCLDPVSKISGGRRYSFPINGQLNLVQRCYARHGRHDFVMHAVVAGPNVFLDCRGDNAHADTGPHHRWATGTLYDNVSVSSQINVEDRQWSGTGHGWAGAQMVFWNCIAGSIICQQPPTAQNFAIGCTAKKAKGHYVKDHPDGWWESPGQQVEPRSLYLKQLEDRLGEEAVTNIGK